MSHLIVKSQAFSTAAHFFSLMTSSMVWHLNYIRISPVLYSVPEEFCVLSLFSGRVSFYSMISIQLIHSRCSYKPRLFEVTLRSKVCTNIHGIQISAATSIARRFFYVLLSHCRRIPGLHCRIGRKNLVPKLYPPIATVPSYSVSSNFCR